MPCWNCFTLALLVSFVLACRLTNRLINKSLHLYMWHWAFWAPRENKILNKAMTVSWCLKQDPGSFRALLMEVAYVQTHLKIRVFSIASTKFSVSENVFHELSGPSCSLSVITVDQHAVWGFVIFKHQLIKTLQLGEAGHAVSLVTPGWRCGGNGTRRRLVFIHNKELQVCQSYSLRYTHMVYPPLQHESSSLSKYIPRLKQGEGWYWQAKMQEATVVLHCP